MRAPTRAYAESANALPTPAPLSISTSCPRRISSSAPAGVSATRYSSDLISFATPILTAREPYLDARDSTRRRPSDGAYPPIGSRWVVGSVEPGLKGRVRVGRARARQG